MEEPRAFFARVKSLLGDDGVFALETLYAPMTLTRTLVEPFIAGASAVYSLGVLERMIRDCDLKIFRGALTDKQGGSIRLYITHAVNEDHDFDPWYERLARLWDEENALSLRTAQPYHAYENRAAEARVEFRKMLATLRGEGACVHLLGAGANANAILAWAGREANAIDAIVAEGGAQTTPGESDHRIISETESRAEEPDYLIAPAPVKREMLERWRESILLGAKLIVPTPAPTIIHTHNYAAELGRTLAGDGAGSVETLRTILGAAGGLKLVGGRDAAAASAAQG